MEKYASTVKKKVPVPVSTPRKKALTLSHFNIILLRWSSDRIRRKQHHSRLSPRAGLEQGCKKWDPQARCGLQKLSDPHGDWVLPMPSLAPKLPSDAS